MGVKILRLRHKTTPPPKGCRWCGFAERGHGHTWTSGAKWHTFVPPTREQLHARLAAQLTARRFPEMTTLPGPEGHRAQ